MPFQNRVNLYNPIGVEGDFASANPRATAIAGPGGFVAGPAGVTIGRFAWAVPSSLADTDATIVNNFGQGAVKPTGFIGRQEGSALITQYLQEYSNVIPQGFGVTIYRAGDFRAKVTGSAPASVGAAVYANYSDGTVSFGSVPAGASATGSIGATFTATGSGTNLTVTAVTGYISPGDTLSGTGVPAGTTVISQTSGTTGGAGVYVTSAATTASAATVTSFGSTLNVSAVASGLLAPGQAISGTGIPAGASIESQVSGATGGVGVYTISTPATAYVASTAVTVAGGILTSFLAASVAAVGELVTIYNWGN